MANQDIYTYDPTLQAAQYARQQKMAELMQQQADQPIDIQSYNGIQAPISWGSVLAKGLKAGLGSYLSGEAMKGEAGLKNADLQKAQEYFQGAKNKEGPYTLPIENMPTTRFDKDTKKLVLNEPVGTQDVSLGLTDPLSGNPLMKIGGGAPRSLAGQRDYAEQAYFSPYPSVRALGPMLTARATPKFENLGARGAMDTNPDSSTYGQIVGAPKEKPNELPDSVQVAEWYRTATPEQRKAWNASKNAGRPVTEISVGPTGIEYGKPEEGLVWARDPNGTVKLDERGAPIAIPYQGGKAFVSNEEKEKKRQELIKQQDMATFIVKDDIRRAKNYINTAEIPVTGIAGAAAKNIPGTPANALNGILTGIKANIGFDKLQQMRQSSPTGGALGNVSDKDIALVQSVYGSLMQSTNEKDLLYNLDRLDKTVYNIVNGTDASASKSRPPLSTFNGKGQ